MKPITRLAWLLILAILPQSARSEDNPYKFNQRIGRGMNLGNALDAPSEGEWGLTLKADYFDQIKQAGFNSVRIPIRWATHTGPGPEFQVDPTFASRVDWAIDQALSRGLVAVINVHHDDDLYKDPEKHQGRLESTWKQIASRYRGRSEQLVFELLNEPNGSLTDEKWQALFPKLLAIVRESNPNRFVIVGPGHWNNVDSLKTLQLPDNDRRLIATFHYYNPFHFTHQGADWVNGSQAWKGETWTGTPEQVEALQKDLDKAARWSQAHDRPVYMGEFGAYSGADLKSRAIWTEAVARNAEKRGFSWAYWEFASGFGAFNPETNRWQDSLKNALVPSVVKSVEQPSPAGGL